jgi:hypothetical protein
MIDQNLFFGKGNGFARSNKNQIIFLNSEKKNEKNRKFRYNG